MLVHLADNLMRGYLPVIGSGDEGVAEEAAVWAAMAFHPNIERTADAILRELGLSQYNAMHVRRGDKQTDPGYDFMFDVLNASFFEAAALAEQFAPEDPVYIASDASAEWLAGLKITLQNSRGAALRAKALYGRPGSIFSSHDILNNHRLLSDLMELPPELWKDYVGLVEQAICIKARGFVGSWPSTYSLYIYNRRLSDAVPGASAAADLSPKFRMFRKLKKVCVDDVAMQQFPHTRLYLAELQRFPELQLASESPFRVC
eukprot:INCI7686.4.p2 GENE.INCI7686.4~~INCI7686.4.p2  ORF type:complete len:260 (-),score=50.87 INCI7686.4:53-832(-)